MEVNGQVRSSEVVVMSAFISADKGTRLPGQGIPDALTGNTCSVI